MSCSRNVSAVTWLYRIVVKRQRRRGSPTALAFIALYADTRHEVLPVESGYWVALTYSSPGRTVSLRNAWLRSARRVSTRAVF